MSTIATAASFTPHDKQPPSDDTQASSIASLRIAAFRRLWIALIIFNVGHLIRVVASSWLILELTGSRSG